MHLGMRFGEYGLDEGGCLYMSRQGFEWKDRSMGESCALRFTAQQ